MDGSGEVNPSTVSEIMWLIIDSELVNKLEVTDRAMTNLTKVNKAFKMGKPIVKFRYSLNMVYDMAFIPKEITNHDEKLQNHYFRQIQYSIANYTESINSLRSIGKEFIKTGDFNFDEFHTTKKRFIQSSKSLNYRMFQYRDRIVKKSLEIAQENIAEFEKKNETLNKYHGDLHYLVDTTIGMVTSQLLTQWRNMKLINGLFQEYISDFNSTKSGLSEILNSESIQDDTIRLSNFFTSLRSRGRDFKDLWAKITTAYKDLYSSILSEPTTMEFYKMLNNDTKELIQDPENKTDVYLKGFAYLLRKPVDEINDTNITDLVTMLNADIPDIDAENKLMEIEKAFVTMSEKSAITKYIMDRDDNFIEIIKKLQRSLHAFSQTNKLGFDFYR